MMPLFDIMNKWTGGCLRCCHDNPSQQYELVKYDTTSPPPYTPHNPPDSTGRDNETPVRDDGQYGGGEIFFTFLKDVHVASFPHCPLDFEIDTDFHVGSDVPWEADVQIIPKDIPKLMREGLHWSEENVDIEMSVVLKPENFAASRRRMGWTHGRFCIMRDRGRNPQWWARVAIYAHGIKELSQFRLSQLSLANVRHTVAYNKPGDQVYIYDAVEPDNNINTMYNDRPLEGWWPWPRAKGKEVEQLEPDMMKP